WQLKWGVKKLDGEIAFQTDDGTTIGITLDDLTAHSGSTSRSLGDADGS
ncbi:MAG: hypothetical protein ACI9HI_001614, partial [Salinirussus sp.]